MLNSELTIMRPIHRSLVRILVGVTLAGVPHVARGQDRTDAVARSSACVAVTGPDSNVAVPDISMRGAAVRPAGDTAQRSTVRLFAAVQAEEVRFDRQPTICVALHGDARLDSVRVVGRRNLASPVVRGTTYRDVYVAVEIRAHLDAECISARITGAAPAGQPSAACTSLGLRDSTAGSRTGAPPP